MNFKILLAVLISFSLLQACSTTKNTSTFWISGYKTEADAGAGKMQALQVHRGENLRDVKWEYFYAPIEGFEFEEGYLQKITVKEEKLDPKTVPADASSIKYTLVKVLDKQKDIRTVLDGSWSLVKLNDAPLNRMVTIPTMDIDLSQKRISGNSGCNNYTGSIKKLTPSAIELSPLASTKKMCRNKNVEDEFNTAINTINTYQIKGNMVTFYDENSKKVLAFMKKD